MPTVEVWGARGLERTVTLDNASYTIGFDTESVDIALADETVSTIHASLERVGKLWLLRDLGSRNGTLVNGDRLLGQLRLRNGDEILLGRTRLRFRDPLPDKTEPLTGPPSNLTRKEKEVLVELCRPLLSHSTFQQPASVREIGSRLFIGKNAVQAHLTNLYDKFEIYEGDDRRTLLANAAIDRGAVTIADLETPPDEGSGHA